MRFLFFLFLFLHVHSCFSRTLPKLEENNALPIMTKFQLPLPTWSQGGGFGSEAIDLGGLQVRQVSSLSKVWTVLEGGSNGLGASFFEPHSIPDDFYMLGSYSQQNDKPLSGWVLVAKDLSPNQDILKKPVDYTLVWSSKIVNASREDDDAGYLWLPMAPEGYKSVGLVVTGAPEKPSLDKVRCVRADFTDAHSHGQLIWSHSNGLRIHKSKPDKEKRGVFTGGFVAALGSGIIVPDACLKNILPNPSNDMPSIAHIRDMVTHYSPRFHFHPNEEYFPMQVTDFFQKGAHLVTKGRESESAPIQPNGENLPKGGSNDGAYWMALPDLDLENLKHGDVDIKNPGVYVHAKPSLGGTHTDLAVWIFYPFNGGKIAKVLGAHVGLMSIGEHVGDWEHVTLRINNFNGALENAFFSQHDGGAWVDAPSLQLIDGSKVAVHASLHGHATYPDEGDHCGEIGILNAAYKGGKFLDTAAHFEVFSTATEPAFSPPWLEYAREWGPVTQHDVSGILKLVDKSLPWIARKLFEKLMQTVSQDALCDEGPTGPKWRESWDGDEPTDMHSRVLCPH